jgi:hypothetical protein
MNFGNIPGIVAPPRVVEVPVSMFAEDWDKKPEFPAKLGVRHISDADVQAARSHASKVATQQHPNLSNEADRECWVEAYNDALMRWIVARAACSAVDAKQYFELWQEAPEDLVKHALTSEGVRFIFDAWEQMKLETSPLSTEATDEEIASMFDLIQVSLPELSPQRQARVRRMLGFCLSELIEG